MKYDAVYFLKEGRNEELRYSLRSIEKNFPFSRVVFYGGKPQGITPDLHIHVKQTEPTKWERVRNMLLLACENDELTDKIWLFNDDFFVMRKIDEPPIAIYDGTLSERITQLEKPTFGRPTIYSKLLRRLEKVLHNCEIAEPLNYATHTPMLIDRKDMAQVLRAENKTPMARSLYGNIYKIGGIDEPDVKYHQNHKPQNESSVYISTSDESWNQDEIGRIIRAQFTEKSRFED